MTSTVRLCDVAEVGRGNSKLTKKRYIPLGVQAYSGSGPDGFVETAEHQTPGVVISAVGANCGRTWYAKGSWTPINNTLWYRANIPEAETRYLYYVTLDPMIWPRRGSAQPFVSMGDAEKILVRLPPVEEQRIVISVLSAFDDLIENNRRRIEILEKMSRLLYREWFVHFRFPGHKEVELLESEFGLIPKGWEIGKFSRLVSERTDTIAPEDITEGVPDIGLKHLPRKSTTLCEWEIAKNVGSRRKLFIEGDILFGKIRPYFHKVVDAPVSGCTTTSAIVFRPRERKWQERALAIASSDEFVALATATSNGTTMPSANVKELLNYMVPHPTEQIEEQFSDLMKPIDALRKNLAAQIRALREMRDLLLPRLISGELDVSELDFELEGVGE